MWASSNQLRAWIEQRLTLLVSKRKLFLPDSIWAGTSVSPDFGLELKHHSSSWISSLPPLYQNYTINCPRIQAFGLNWNYSTCFPESPAFWLQSLRLISLQNCVTQFLVIKSLCLSIYILLVLFLCGNLTNTRRSSHLKSSSDVGLMLPLARGNLAFCPSSCQGSLLAKFSGNQRAQDLAGQSGLIKLQGHGAGAEGIAEFWRANWRYPE